jgi:hypothetical protein
MRVGYGVEVKKTQSKRKKTKSKKSKIPKGVVVGKRAFLGVTSFFFFSFLFSFVGTPNRASKAIPVSLNPTQQQNITPKHVTMSH